MAKYLIDKLTPAHLRDVKTQGASLANVIQAAADLIKTAYHAGQDLKQAFEDAIDYIKQNWDVAWGKFDDHEDLIRHGMRQAMMEEESKRTLTAEEINDAIRSSIVSKPLMQQIKESKMVQKTTEVIKGIGLTFHPAMFEGKDLARDAMMLIRKEKGKEARENEQADIASRKLMNDWNWVPKVDKLGFILSIENPKQYGQASPEYKALADQYRARMDKVFEELSKTNFRSLPQSKSRWQ